MWHGILFHFKKKFLKIRDHQDAYSVMNSFWKYKCNNEVEYFFLLGVDIDSSIQFMETIFVGSRYEVNVDLKHVFKEMLDKGIYQFCVAHNHPSNSIRISSDDVLLTESINDLSIKLGFTFMDHLILTNKTFNRIPISRV